MITEPITRSPQAEQCCLHVGLPKTATKMLQIQLFARHSQVEFLGTYIGSRRQYRQCRDAEVEEIINELIWDNRLRPNLPRCRELYRKSIAPAFEAGRLPVWSWESLMEDGHEVQRRRAENLKAVFGDCKLVIGLRHPLRLVESLYLQLIKRDNVGSRASFRAGVHYLPIDAWIRKNWERPGHAPTAHLEYAEAVEVFADVFGREAVGIFLFEQLREDQAAFIEAICRFLRIDTQEGVIHTRGQRENDRWAQPQLDRLKRIHGSLLRSTLFRFANRRTRRRMLGLMTDGSGGPPARAEISRAWQERILDKTREGNRRLVQRWNLPLERYDYPL